MNKYLKNFNKKDLNEHVNALKEKAKADIPWSADPLQKRFAELLAKTPAGIKEPEFDLSKTTFGDNNPAIDLKNTKGFDIYVKDTFILQAIEKESPFVESKIKRIEEEVTVKENIDVQFASNRTWLQRHFSVFRTREDKANKHLLNLKKEELKTEEKYSAKLLKTHDIIEESKNKFEEVNKTKLQKLYDHAYELKNQRQQRINQTPPVRVSELTQINQQRQQVQQQTNFVINTK